MPPTPKQQVREFFKYLRVCQKREAMDVVKTEAQLNSAFSLLICVILGLGICLMNMSCNKTLRPAISERNRQ